MDGAVGERDADHAPTIRLLNGLGENVIVHTDSSWSNYAPIAPDLTDDRSTLI
jgi:hypothetical protein